MKRFLSILGTVLVIVECFLFFGGYALFDFAKHPYLTGAVAALIIAVIAQVFAELYDEIDTLKKRIKEMEERHQ